MYFSDCYTADQCKKRYRQLAIQLHPDKTGGDGAEFKKMMEEYESRLRELQKKAPLNSSEAIKLAKAILDFLRVAKPEYYQMIQMITVMPMVDMLTMALGKLFPQKNTTINEFINLLK